MTEKEADDGIEQTKVWKVLFCEFEELENTCNHLASDGYMIIKILETLPTKLRGGVAVVAFSQEKLVLILQARNAGNVAAQLTALAKQAGAQPP